MTADGVPELRGAMAARTDTQRGKEGERERRTEKVSELEMVTINSPANLFVLCTFSMDQTQQSSHN